MIVTFKATLDDFAEATYHSLKKRRRLRPWYRRLSTYAILLIGIGAGRFLSNSEPLKLAIGLMIALLLMGCDEFLYRKLIYRRSRDFHLKKLGFKLPLKYEVELSDEGLKLKEGDEESVIEWEKVMAIERSKERIFLVEADSAVSVVPLSAFSDEAQQRKFIETAAAFLKKREKER
jgi:hypothetical protein